LSEQLRKSVKKKNGSTKALWNIASKIFLVLK